MDNFKEDHKIAFDDNSELHAYGEPDQVDGWYSRKLSYMEWYRLACAKRAHQELVENAPLAMVFELIGALKFPLPCIAVGLVYLVGAAAYAKCYAVKGARNQCG